ncbi:hypothetical protein PG996_003829 [Apiospora saccharicola]|uniref:Uncharacterized protein n=1 Tax=Apiospora saccharicola TaxID=335842 RepID=A0ABR1W684_9PEZI
MEVLVELVCRLYQFAGLKFFWIAIARTWLETHHASNTNIQRMRTLITIYRQARIRYLKTYLKEHEKAAKGVTGLAKAMDWWIDRVGTDFNAEARLKPPYAHEDKKAAVRSFESLLSDYHTKIAQRPLFVFHHPCWVPAYKSWKHSHELRGYPLMPFLSKERQIPRITEKSLELLGRMDKNEWGTSEQNKEKYTARLKDYFMAEHTNHA